MADVLRFRGFSLSHGGPARDAAAGFGFVFAGTHRQSPRLVFQPPALSLRQLDRASAENETDRVVHAHRPGQPGFEMVQDLDRALPSARQRKAENLSEKNRLSGLSA